ncbi:hypothetical protein KY284_015033 [Solanum tuberosum]|nr:hypothetical protein KY284_015033 [Solanum tuberosum]
MDAHTVHLAMAALVGASIVAVSAYYMHRKTLNQLLEFAKAIEKDRDPDDVETEDGGGGYSRNYAVKRRNRSGSKGSNGYYRGSSASFPDVMMAKSGEVEERRNGPIHVDSIPAGLPRLHTLPEGKSRSTHSLRPTSPKSPVASASAFESIEGSDEEDNITGTTKLDTAYLHTNGNAGPDADGEQIAVAAAASMIRSHSVSGDLHGVQPDPIAADILRKEPEQETFVRLKISPGGNFPFCIPVLGMLSKALKPLCFF